MGDNIEAKNAQEARLFLRAWLVESHKILESWLAGTSRKNFGVKAALSEKTDKPRDLIDHYMHLTKTVLPSMARSGERDWPVREDHCFQRIVLDTICGGVWYDHLDRPAYKHLTNDQAQRAVELCRDIVEGKADLRELNHKSLIWRGKWPI